MNEWPKVLVVDDEPQQSLLASCIVKEVWPGADVHVARDGNEAVQAVSALRPDLVLTDIRLPGQDGVEVCRAIKSDPYLARAAKVVAMTGFDDPEVRSDALPFGADAYLTKPIEPETWRKSLARLLTGPGMTRKEGWSWVG